MANMAENFVRVVSMFDYDDDGKKVLPDYMTSKRLARAHKTKWLNHWKGLRRFN